MSRLVQGFKYVGEGEEFGEFRGNICQVIARAEASDSEVLEYGPAFLVRFGDGTDAVVHANELQPWYPT